MSGRECERHSPPPTLRPRLPRNGGGEWEDVPVLLEAVTFARHESIRPTFRRARKKFRERREKKKWENGSTAVNQRHVVVRMRIIIA